MWVRLIKILSDFNDHYDKALKDNERLGKDYAKLKLAIFVFAAFATISGTLGVEGKSVHSSVCVVLMFIAAYGIPMVAKAMALQMHGVSFRTKEFEDRAMREEMKRKEKEKKEEEKKMKDFWK